MNTDKPIKELIEDFLSEHQGTPGTIKKYRENLKVFIDWISVNPVDVKNIKFSDLVLYKAWLEKSGRSTSTVVCYIVSVRQFFVYLEDAGIYQNIARKLKAYNKDKTFRRKPLRPDQVTKLLSSIVQDTVIGKRDYAIINLMVRTGLRSVEVTRLDMGDFEQDGSAWVMRVQRKGQKQKNDIQGITLKSIDPILAYFNQRDQDIRQPAFINHGRASHKDDLRMDPKTISRIVKERLRAIGINDPLISCHSLRHGCACAAIAQGTDIFLVKAMMGHKDISTTMIYVRYMEDEIKRKGLAGQNVDKAY